MIGKQDLLNLFKKEYATTLKVLQAYPEDQSTFKPHERSHEAVKLASTFVFEMYLLKSYLFGEELDRSKFQTYNPQGISAVIEDFQKEADQVIAQLGQLPDDGLTKSVEFGGKSFTADEFALMMIHDQIHHRGQLSVYVRMAGGKVPSIYGPSADDESTNL